MRFTTFNLALAAVLTWGAPTYAYDTDLVGTKNGDGANVSTYVITTDGGRAVVGQRVDIYGQTNAIVAEIKGRYGNVPDSVRKVVAAIAPENRADVVALIFDNDGALVDAIAYQRDGAIDAVESAQAKLEQRAIKEKKLRARTPYRDRADRPGKERQPGEKTRERPENTLGDARDRGVKITDGTPEGRVEMGPLTDGNGEVVSGGGGGGGGGVSGCRTTQCPKVVLKFR